MIHVGPRVSDVLNRYGSYEPDFEPFPVPARQIISCATGVGVGKLVFKSVEFAVTSVIFRTRPLAPPILLNSRSVHSEPTQQVSCRIRSCLIAWCSA